jgi:hypothetical protein
MTVALLGAPVSALAVPTFSGQTGLPCTACHIGAFGPQLTPTGRAFKIEGYTASGGTGVAADMPLSALVLTSYTNTDRNQPAPASEHYGANGNFAADQISIFLAGRVNDHVGGLIQTTFDGIQSKMFVDNSDIRVVDQTQLFGAATDIGLSFNNAPGLSDPYNSTYPFGYSFAASALAPTPTAGTILGGQLAGNALGINAYMFRDEHFYLDLGLYDTQAPSLMRRLGEEYGPGSATAPAPYARAAYEWTFGESNAHIGVTFFHTRFNPAYDSFGASGAGGHDSYTDTALDGGYQYFHDKNTLTLDARINHEDQSLNGSQAGGNPSNRLNDFRATETYYYDNTYGLTVSADALWGNKNPGLYPSDSQDDGGGSADGSPNSNWLTLEADYIPFGKADSLWAPFANLKLGAQYTIYTKFNGSGKNYDGYGRNASDNNTLYLYAWTVF